MGCDEAPSTPHQLRQVVFLTSTENKKESKSRRTSRVLLDELSCITPIKSRQVQFHIRAGSKPYTKAMGRVVRPAANTSKIHPAPPTKSVNNVSKGYSNERILRVRVQELETLLKRKDSELTGQRAKVNQVQTCLREKEKHIRDLELKLPRVLSDISRGFGSKGTSAAGTEREMRNSMKRNHDLSLKVKELEGRLKESEKKLQEATRLNERFGQEAAKREVLLKRTQLKLQALPQVKLKELEEEKIQLTGKLALAHKTIADQESSLGSLRQENEFLYGELNTQYDQMLATERELSGLWETVAGLQKRVEELELATAASVLALAPSVGSAELLSVPASDASARPAEPPSAWDLSHEATLLNITYPFSHDQYMELEDLIDHNLDVSGSEEELFEANEDLPDGFFEDEDEDDEDEFNKEEDGEAEFNTSQEEEDILSRVETLDFKLCTLLNRLNSTVI